MASLPDSPRKRFTLTELAVLCAIVIIIAAIAVPGFLSSQRASNERGTSASLKTLSSAEADFRSNDRDWNHVNDFWTGDVKGLYTLTSAAIAGAGTAPKDPPIELIHLSVAAADADPTFFPAAGENMPLGGFAPSGPKAGHWFAALTLDRTVKDTKETTYRLDTGGTPTMGAVHNESKFGFVAFPELPGRSGKYVFRVNENNTIFREPATGPRTWGPQRPPGLNSLPSTWLEWPSDEQLKSYWSKIE